MWESAAGIGLDDDARRLLTIGVVHGSPVQIGAAGPGLLAEMDGLCASLLATHAGMTPGSDPALAPARDLYRAFGMDPTHTRPSSEALLRRVLSGKGLPRILNAVDLCNLCALKYLLPIGLYDVSRVEPPVTIRRGRAGEAYAGIRKDEVRLEGRPVVADSLGPFGNPTSDSQRTSVSEATRSLVMVIFAPAGYPAPRLLGHVADAREGMERHLPPAGGRTITSATVLPEARETS